MRLGRDVVDSDLYAELDVPRDATSDLIQKEYRRRVRLSHPDLNPEDAHAAKRMARLNRAAEVLLDPTLRDEYDRARSRRARNASHAPAHGAHRTNPKRAERAWYQRKSRGGSCDWVSSDAVHQSQSVAWDRGTGFEAFQRELRGEHGDRIVRLVARVQAWTRPRQRLLAGGLLALGISLIVSLRPVTLGIGPENARQPVTVSVQALLP